MSPEEQKLQRELMQEPEAAARRFRAENSDPSTASLDLLADSERFEGRLRRAVSVNAPEGGADRWLQRLQAERAAQAGGGASRSRPVWLTAIAAVLVGAIGVGLSLTPRESQAKRLQTAMLDHLSHESSELDWAREHGSLSTSKLADGALGGESVPVIYLNLCKIDGVLAVHSIVETRDGQVTALYLPSRDIERAVAVDDGGMHGRILDANEGVSGFFGGSEAAIRELSERHAAEFAEQARRVLDSSSAELAG